MNDLGAHFSSDHTIEVKLKVILEAWLNCLYSASISLCLFNFYELNYLDS